MIEDPNKTCKKTYANNVLLLGDAAGFLCPFEAEGVYYAMLSGKIAVDIAKRAHDTGDFSEDILSSYEEEWRNSPIGEEFELGPAFSKIVHGLFFNPIPTANFVEMVNDLLFGLSNVAESHHYNLNHLEGLLEKHFPFIRKVLDEYGDGFTSCLTKKPPIDVISILKAYLETQIKKNKKRDKKND